MALDTKILGGMLMLVQLLRMLLLLKHLLPYSSQALQGLLELQDSVIARQEEEISSLKGQIVGLQQQLMVAADRTADLTLKSSGTTLQV